MTDIHQLAQALYEAQEQRRPIPPLTQTHALSVEDAYQIQRVNIERRVGGGDSIVGYKVGLTSKPMQRQLGVGEPDFGHLLQSMAFRHGEVVAYPLIQPKVEAEIAFVLREALAGPGLTEADVLRATEYVVPAIEVIDSRIADWKIQLADTVADNASSGCFVVGDGGVDPRTLNLATLGGVLYVNGEVAETGAGAAVLGHPARSVAWLANKLGELGTTLHRGAVVLSGAISAAVPVRTGDRVEVSFGRLGRVSVRMGE